MTVNSVRPPDDNAARPTGESEFDATDAAGELDAVGALDLFAPDAALGTLRRFRPDSSMMRYAFRLASRPGTVAARYAKLAAELASIAAGSSAITPARRDRRFADPAWGENPLLRRTVQAYLAVGQTAEALLADAELDWRDSERMKFVLTNLIAASAPSNYPLHQPGRVEGVHRHRRPERGPGYPCPRLRYGRCPAHPDDGRARCVQGRQGSRRDARSGGGPHRRLRAHPIPADRVHRVPVPAAHGPADDEQVLHNGPCAGPQHDRVLCRAGISGTS